MRTLFTLDAKDYTEGAKEFVRPSVRAIVIKDRMIALVYSDLYGYYKFAGGGIEGGEDHLAALIREVKEEIGLVVLPETVRPYGKVLRKEKRDDNAVFVQENYYYLCDVGQTPVVRDLDDYEAEERFELRWVDPQEAIAKNRAGNHGKKSPYMIERESRVLETLINEGYFG